MVCMRADDGLVCPDMKTPLEPGGKVSNIPGLKAKNKTVVTTRSVRVSTRPMAFAIKE